MNTFRNTDTHRRVWPSIARPDGTTLELGASETAELDLPRTFVDTYLESTKKPTKKELEQDGQDPQDETPTESAVSNPTDENKESKS